MGNAISKTIVAGVAALSLGASALLTAEPASAQWHGGGGGGGWHGGGGGGGWHGGGGGWHGGGGGWHGGGGGYWHGGYWRGGTWYNGWWGPAAAAGILLGAGAVAAYPYYGYGYGYGGGCWQNRPVYGVGGAYLGYQMVNVCQ